MARDVRYIHPSEDDFPQPVLLLMGLTGMRPWRVSTESVDSDDNEDHDPNRRHFFFPCDDSDTRQVFADAARFVTKLFCDLDGDDPVYWRGAYQVEEDLGDEAVLRNLRPPCREIRMTVYGSPTISNDIDWRPEETIPEDYYAR